MGKKKKIKNKMKKETYTKNPTLWFSWKQNALILLHF